MDLIKQAGLASWGLREISLEEQLKLTKKLNTHYLELSIANTSSDISLEASKEELEEVKKLYEKYGILLTCAATGNDFTCDTEDKVKEEISKVLKVLNICNMLGVTFLRIFAGFSPVSEVYGKRWDTMILALIQVADYAEKLGIILAVETHGGVEAYEDGIRYFHSVTTNRESLERLLNKLPENIMFVLDPANLYAVGIKKPEMIYKTMKQRIAYMHLKDFVKLPSGNLLPAACGDSDMDWKSFLQATRNFTGPMLIEYEIPADVEIGCKKSLDYIKNLLK